MTLCINPNCAQPNHADNDTQAHCPSCGAELIIQGRYRVMRLLTDNSGFGVVYEAFERDRPKILKLLKPSHSHHPKAVQLFEQEALVLSRLQHPGVPSIATDGCFQIIPTPGADPLHCIVMEKIDGPNLSEWMRQQGHHPISEHQALQWLQQLTEVLHLVHQQQYFHRDIKPDNIMLRSNGQLVLVDFGAVREVSYAYFEQLDSTGGITRISSIGYTAPEQERGKAVPQSDFYSLGCTFIYLLTGKKPLAPDIYDSLTNEFHWRSFAPHISSGLADFIDQLTAARVIDRPPNTLEILAKIGELQTTLSRDRHGQQNHISGQSIGGFTGGQSRQDGSHASSSASPISAFPSSNGLPSSSSMDLDLDNTATLPPDHTFIGSIAPPSSGLSSATSSVSSSASDSSSGSSSRTFPPSPSPPSSASTPPSGKRTVAPEEPPAAAGEETTAMQPSATLLQAEARRFPIRLNLWIVVLLFLLGGIAIFWGGRSLYRAHLANLEQPDSPVPPALSFRSISRLEGHTSAINDLAMSLDQKMLISASDDRTIRLWDLVAGQEIRQLVGHRDRVQAVAISPNGQIIASGGGDNLIKLWNPLTGEAIANLTGHSGPINDLVITADGQRLVSASADKTIKVWDLDTYEELTTLQGHNSFVNTLDISPDGTVLASGSADRTIKLWSLSTYQDIATLSGHDSFINTLVFSLNGNTLISGGADHHIKIWDDKTYEQTYEPIHSLEQHTSFVNALAMTFDGQYLVSTSADQSIRVWDLGSQTSLTTIPWKNTFVNAVVIRFTGSTWQILAGGQGSSSIQIWNLEESPLQ